jgi:hypothetical protein
LYHVGCVGARLGVNDAQRKARRKPRGFRFCHHRCRLGAVLISIRVHSGKSGHLLILVPASWVAEVEAALTFLEGKRQQRGSQVVIDLIVRAALRNGWRPPLHEGESTTRL